MSNTFEDLVAKDVRGECTEAELDILKGDIRGWLAELNSLKRDVELQLGAQKARITKTYADMLETATKQEWLNYKAGQEQWKVTAGRFMASVEARILYVKSLRAAAGSQKQLVAS